MEKLWVIVDKNSSDAKNLADIMDSHSENIQEILNKYPQALITHKPDGSPVTELDLALSEFVESLLSKYWPKFTFYSEEKFSAWSFPLFALDPLDGTREYIHGRDEWAISIGLFQNENFEGEGWVNNPKTKEVYSRGEDFGFKEKEKYVGEVSRSEWEQGLLKNKMSERFPLTPMGSIAYKLGRLSGHKIDYVVSLRPKNIWDIAGGTLLCKESGYKFYSEGREVSRVQQYYKPPLIWCRPEIFSELKDLFS